MAGTGPAAAWGACDPDLPLVAPAPGPPAAAGTLTAAQAAPADVAAVAARREFSCACATAVAAVVAAVATPASASTKATSSARSDLPAVDDGGDARAAPSPPSRWPGAVPAAPSPLVPGNAPSASPSLETLRAWCVPSGPPSLPRPGRPLLSMEGTTTKPSRSDCNGMATSPGLNVGRSTGSATPPGLRPPPGRPARPPMSPGAPLSERARSKRPGCPVDAEEDADGWRARELSAEASPPASEALDEA
mmetsp:Transcript_2432/g.9586  ORF Transcript_2432/g.9586 Transcript_2432/m.9586 type:complete len:248 (+) Transcript_2432:1633-2376(+)